MPQLPEETPFLADNDQYGEENHAIRVLPANAHFKRPLKIITIIISGLSISVFALLIFTWVKLSSGPFNNTWGSRSAVRDLSIVLFVNFILAAPTAFFQIPILINLAIQIAMSIVVLVFSSEIFNRGWPDSYTCGRWQGPPNYGLAPGKPECLRAKEVVSITMGVSGGIGILIGLLLLTNLLLRAVALFRTRFWKCYSNNIAFPKWNPTGFTVQFTLSVLPNENRRKTAGAVAPAAEEEAQLIEA